MNLTLAAELERPVFARETSASTASLETAISAFEVVEGELLVALQASTLSQIGAVARMAVDEWNLAYGGIRL